MLSSMSTKSRFALAIAGGIMSAGLALPFSSTAAIAQPSGSIAASIDRWNMLRRDANAPFESYAGFILAHRDWPNETDLRRRAERNIQIGVTSPQEVVRFFAALPPLTAQGHAAHALALEAAGQRGPAIEAARRAWWAGALPEGVEQRLLANFGSGMGPADHDRRTDALLAENETGAARRMLPYVSPSRRALYQARLTTGAERQSLLAGLGESAARDPGLIWERARAGGARQLLASRPRFDRPPANPEAYLELMIREARGAANDGNSRQAYEIASRLDDLYPEGTDVSLLSYNERDEYTNLAWLAGRTAFRANRFAEAAESFDRYGRAARSAQTRAKGFYWAARAAERAGDQGRSRRWLEQAAAGSDQFYGLLALERLGRRAEAPEAAPSPSAGDRANFLRRSLVEAIRYSGQSGRRGDQSVFIRALASSLDNDRDRTLAAEFGQSIGRPDLAVWVAREARSRGDTYYARQGFPTMYIPVAFRSVWSEAHGIMRQESSFDRGAQSHAGARGMMQLMPATAASEARRAGVPYNLSRLTEDADYNIHLGSQHLAGLMERFNNNLVLVAVAYNAGAGRVPQWIARNGDPRSGGVDVIDWIEDVPFAETRNYIQRVIENAMVYDLMSPGGSRSQGRVSYFLGGAGAR